MPQITKRSLARLVGYAFWGVLTFILDLALIYLFIEWFVPGWLAVSVAFFISTNIHYVLTKVCVFNDCTESVIKTFNRFLIISIGMAVIITASVWGIMHVFGGNIFIVRTLVGCVFGLVGFALNARFNFKTP